jgi:hypothetical protein
MSKLYPLGRGFMSSATEAFMTIVIDYATQHPKASEEECIDAALHYQRSNARDILDFGVLLHMSGLGNQAKPIYGRRLAHRLKVTLARCKAMDPE